MSDRISNPNKQSRVGPRRITFDTNQDDCNMYCIMCEEHSEFSPLKQERIRTGRPHRIMDIGIIRKTVNEMAPLGLKEIIPSTMGEPLLYEHFLDIIDICRENGIKLNLTTNGTWPRYGARKWAEMICPVASDVKISWNGSNSAVQESIMKGSLFNIRLHDLTEFIEVRDSISKRGGNRCRVTLQATFMESNASDLPSLVKLAIDLGIDRVKGHQLWAHIPEIKNLDIRRSTESASHWNRTVEMCHEIAETYKLSNGKHIMLENFNYIPENDNYDMPSDWE